MQGWDGFEANRWHSLAFATLVPTTKAVLLSSNPDSKLTLTAAGAEA